MKPHLFFLLFLISISGVAQEADSVYRALLPVLIEEGQNSRMLITQEERNEAAERFANALKTICAYPEAINFSFEGVDNVLSIQSEDGHLRVLSYMIPQRNLIYTHRAQLLYRNGDEYKSVALIDQAQGGRSETFRLLSPSSWYGGLYYAILQREKEGEQIYFVLGYRSENQFIQQKFIDAVTVTDGVIRFGAKAFRVGEFNDFENPMPPYRLMMNYSADHGAMMQWDENYEGIIMDHVAPPDIAQKGVYMSYGPDFTYDGLKWEEENWILEEGIQFENEMITLPANGSSTAPAGLGPEDR